MILVATTILSYAVGVEHPLREPCRRLLRAHGNARVEAATTIEERIEAVLSANGGCFRTSSTKLRSTSSPSSAARSSSGYRYEYTYRTLCVYNSCMARLRTNIEIDDVYVRRIMERYGVHTKTEAVDLALRHLAGQPMTREEALAMEGARAISELPLDSGPVARQ